MAWRAFRIWTQWFLRGVVRQLKRAPAPFSATATPPHAFRIAKPEPKQHARRKPDWVPAEIVRLKAQAPTLGGEKIAATFNRLYAHACKVTVGKTYVCEILRKHRYEIERMRERTKHRVPRAIARNRVWGFDLTGKGDENGNMLSIAGLIDHGTRRALVLEPVADRTAAGLLKVVIAAVERFGAPRAIRTDNEAVFHSPEFEAGLKVLGIKHQFTRLACPWQNGTIEKLFGTLKEKLDRFVVANAQALAEALAIFRDWYNDVRPHNHLNGLTPGEAWDEIDPYRLTPRRVDVFDEWNGLLQGFRIGR